jgi:hypothetical protein
MGAGIHGGFGETGGSPSSQSKNQSLPTNDAQLKHIFSGKNGHLSDTPENRNRLPTLQMIEANSLVKINMVILGMRKSTKMVRKHGFVIKTERSMKAG